jgi:hypothetical protein
MAIHKAKDNSFKLILGNHELFVEFLRDFINIDLLKNVQPEDIEDISERFLPLFQENRDSDTVKRIRLKDDAQLFVIAIVEHESEVNYRSGFKLLQYITLVLDAYENDANEKQKGISATKDFRYPPVLPIVFYDGTDKWTAEMNFRDRTALNEVFGKYIPSFEYELVDLNRYTQSDLIQFSDALSLIMIIDKVRFGEGTSLLSKLPKDYIERLNLQIPENLNKLLTDVITVLLDRIETPPDAIAEITDLVEKKEKQTMFEGFVAAVLEERRLDREEGRAEGWEEGREEAEEKAHQKDLEAARKLKARGFSDEEISGILQIAIGEIVGL